MSAAVSGKGFLAAFFAYFMWGLLPLYWKLLISVNSLHILGFRILLSLVLVGIPLALQKKTAWLSVFGKRQTSGLMILTALLLCCNWGIYIWAVNSGYTLEVSLGYYINPLVSIVLGLIFFRERLRPLQWVAVAIAFAGVLILTVLSGTVPVISLSLALTFGFYGLLKKKFSLSALESLGAETLASAPVGIVLLCLSFGQTTTFAGFQSLAYLGGLAPQTLALLAVSGLLTALPLYFLAHGAKLLPLSALGFTQFISPTLNFVVGLFVFRENFPLHNFVAFGFIWAAAIIYSISLRLESGKKGNN
jgi:chloramphenicol-sensitive protein RarD